jgi:PAS domain S-box-containing protein
MAESGAVQGEAGELRQRAETVWRERRANADQGPEDTSRLLYELEVHQIELEMQNEELRRAQAALSASHARYFDLFDLAPAGYLTLDGAGLIAEANLAAATLLGVERSRLIKQPLTRYILQEDQDIYYLHHRRLAGTSELRLRRADGSACWVRMQSVQGEDNEAEGTSRVILSDISERKQAEEQIRFQAGLLQAVGQAVIVSDLDMAVIYWNRYAEKLYGWPVDEALGRALPKLLLQRVSTQTLKTLEANLQAGRSWSGDLEVTGKNGELFSAFFDFAPVQDQQGKLVGAISVSRDNTQREHAEAELRMSREQLRSLSQRLVSAQESEREVIAHRLFDDESQRLAAVLLALGEVERDVTGCPAVLPKVTALKQMVDSLMRDLHGLAVDLRPAALDRLGLMAALRQYAEQLSVQNNFRIEFKMAGIGNVRLTHSAETTMYRIAQEALTNAIQHSRGNHLSVVASRIENRIVVVIEDNGAGFDVEEALRSGHLGLIGMQERAQMLGGKVSIESTVGSGTAVYVEVPLAAA